jgi:hypothetical protein
MIALTAVIAKRERDARRQEGMGLVAMIDDIIYPPLLEGRQLTEKEIQQGREWLDRKRKELGLRKRGDNGKANA